MKQGRYTVIRLTHCRTHVHVIMRGVLLALCLFVFPVEADSNQPDNRPSPNIAASDTVPAAIPEPATLLMFLSAISLLLYRGIGRKFSSEARAQRYDHVSEPESISAQQHCMEPGQKTAEVVHDVKNLLTGIRTCAEVLRYPHLPPQERLEFTATIISNVDQAVDMLQSLLDVAKGGAAGLQIEPCSLHVLITDILRTLKPDFAQGEIEIQTEFTGNMDCLIDPAQMTRAFTNILINARDAMPEGGTLTISSRMIDDTIEVSIADTGCGMSPELQAQIFDPFVTHGKPHGTGLGMAIVKGILDAHQASITIHSQAGQGATVRIALPKASAFSPTSSAQNSSGQQPSGQPGTEEPEGRG